MAHHTDGENFVTDNNTGGFYVCQCQSCDAIFNSKHCDGGEPIADQGDFGDAYCPNCGEVDPQECDAAAAVWNTQQRKINKLSPLIQVSKIFHALLADLPEEYKDKLQKEHQIDSEILSNAILTAVEATQPLG